MFGTTRTLPRAGCPAKLSNRGEKGLDQGLTKNLINRAREFLCGDGRTFQKDNISAALHQSGLYDRVARRKPVLSKRHMTACLEFAKRHLKDSQTMKNKIEHFGRNAKCHIWRKPGTAPHLPIPDRSNISGEMELCTNATHPN